MVLRIQDQDHTDPFEARDWMHRVETEFSQLGYPHPEVVEEFGTPMGDLELAQLQALARALPGTSIFTRLSARCHWRIDPVPISAASVDKAVSRLFMDNDNYS